MPISNFDLMVAVAIMIGLPIAIILLNRWRSRSGWWLFGCVIAFIIIGNINEQSVGRQYLITKTGSPMEFKDYLVNRTAWADMGLGRNRRR